MYIRKKYNKNIFNIFFSLSIFVIFSYFIVFANKYKVEKNLNGVNAAFFEIKENNPNGYIALDNIITVEDTGDYKFTYIVQPKDNLSKIAYKFGITVENIKKTNNLDNNTISPGQKLTITENDGIIHQLEEAITIGEFAKKYSLNKEKLKKLNYIEKENKKLSKNDEIFLPIGLKKAKSLGIIGKEEKEQRKDVRQKRQENNNQSSTQSQNSSSAGSSITKKQYYRPSISNGFYRGHCTRYVAIKKFPYKSKYKQQKLWNGNAKEWYYNAKAAGYDVGQTAKKGAVAVIKYGAGRYYYYGHVGIVKKIDWENRRMLLDEMNALGRFIVTKRWVPMDNKIIGYIYL